MMGFETIVRPSVFPNIRPQPWQVRLPSAVAVAAILRGGPRTITEPPAGSAVIHGNPAKQINLTTTTSISISRSLAQETQRRVDRVRVYQKQDDGTINKDNFVDVEVANRLRLRDANGTFIRYYRRALQTVSVGEQIDNIELLQRDLIYNSVYSGTL